MDGLWLQSAEFDGEVLSDSLAGDGLIRTEDPGARLILGAGSNRPGTLTVSAGGAALLGHLAVAGGLTAGSVVADGVDVAPALSNMGSLIAAVSAGNLAPGSVRTSAIADASVTASKIAGVLPASVGGTGAGGFPATAVPFGGPPAARGGLSADAAGLSYSAAQASLWASNAMVGGRLHVIDDILSGSQGGVRYRLRVDGAGGGDLLLTRLDAAGVETPFINFSDVKALLDNVSVVRTA